jgi:hypothetical protein
MANVRIPVSADFDGTDIDRAVQQFAGQMNRLASSVAEANNTRFDPIDDSTVDDIKKVTQQFEALKRVSDSFNKRLKETGQDKLGLFDVDFHKLYENQRAGARKALDVLQYVTAGTTFASGMPKPAADNNGSGQSPVPSPSGGSPATNGWQHWGGNIFHSAMGAAGPGGQVISNAVSAGMSGGLKAGLMGLAGGAVALGVGKLVSSAKDKVDDVGQEYIGYDHLKRSLGDVNVGFGALKDSLRSASDSIAETYAEGQKLGIEFAKVSGLSRDQAQNLAKEVAVSGGFSWSFGMDKHQGNQFFAQMRQFKVTNNDSDTRRTALMIGEGIARSGAFSKADELMQAIAGYTANQARTSLTVPNVDSYTGMLAGMVGSGIPGLDPQGAAALLGRVNAAIASGGGAGEAGQNFLYRALGGSQGITDPIMVRMLQEGGMFGTPATTFGSDSFSKFAKRNNIETPQFADPNATNFESAMSYLDAGYGSRPLLKLSAMTRLFNVNYAQALALDNIHYDNPEALSGMATRLGRVGKDIKDVSYTAVPMLANIQTGDKQVLSGVVSDLRGRTGEDKLNDKERGRLNKTIEESNESGDLEPLRDILTELAATRGMQQTEGSRTQELIVGTNNRLSDLAKPLLSMTNDIRTGILFLASKSGLKPESLENEKSYKELNAAHRKLDKINGVVSDENQQSSPGASITKEPVLDPPDSKSPRLADEHKELQRIELLKHPEIKTLHLDGSPATENPRKFVLPNAAMEKRKQDILSQLPDDLRQEIENDPIFQMQVAKESEWRHRDRHGNIITSRKGAYGLTQLLKSTAVQPGYEEYGAIPLAREEDVYDLEKNARAGLYYSRALRRKEGDDILGVAMYNMGPGNFEKRNKAWWTVDETRNYVHGVMAGVNKQVPVPYDVDAANDSMKPLPEEHNKRLKEQQRYEAKITLDGTFNGHEFT